MKPRIIVFGLPKRTQGGFAIHLHAGSSDIFPSQRIFSMENDESGEVSGHPSEDIEIGTQVRITIISLGITYDEHTITYLGGDISYVPLFRKEKNTTESQVGEDWDLVAWRAWNPRATHREGIEAENKALVAREIVKVPIQDSYFYESRIDYTEKFHKLWIGLNAYATNWSNETGDQLKILSLVNSPLSETFRAIIDCVRDEVGATRYRTLQQTTGVNMSSDIVRDEIGRSCSVFEFLGNAKSLSAGYASDSKELDGLAFLNTRGLDDIFLNIFGKFHQFMASEVGMPMPFNLADAFKAPYAPASVGRFGRLLFHIPFEDNSDGRLFGISDFFGSVYAGDPYRGQITRDGQPNQDKQRYEKANPLLFRYLNLLYEFRCAYFHGSLPITEQNNELARSAYLSLREIYPAILR